MEGQPDTQRSNPFIPSQLGGFGAVLGGRYEM